MQTMNVPKKRAATEHHSFWLRPDTMRYIRQANKLTRIPQGQILQLILDYFRLTRRQKDRELTPDERSQLDYVEFFLRILPL